MSRTFTMRVWCPKCKREDVALPDGFKIIGSLDRFGEVIFEHGDGAPICCPDCAVSLFGLLMSKEERDGG